MASSLLNLAFFLCDRNERDVPDKLKPASNFANPATSVDDLKKFRFGSFRDPLKLSLLRIESTLKVKLKPFPSVLSSAYYAHFKADSQASKI